MRLMTWNINRFNQATLDRSIWNEDYIYDTATQQALDIFIVIEVQTAQAGARGQLITGNGRTGVLSILAELRTHDPDWCLVPPARLSPVFNGNEYNEGIAVFYNNHTLNFTGPNYIDANRITTPNVLNAAAAYPNPWDDALPAGNNRAGRVDFQHFQNHNVLDFPANQDRRPWYTEFTERGGALRNLKLFSVHLPPDTTRATQACLSLAAATELRNVGANDVMIVAGDFNVNLVNFQNFTYLERTNYQQLYLAMGQAPEFGGALTRIEGVNAATPQGGGPGYGYLLNESLDNVFLRYGAGLVAPAHNEAVGNRVIGTGVYSVDMRNTIPQIQGMNNLTGAAQNTLFRRTFNYGHLAVGNGGVSDHLPLVLEI